MKAGFARLDITPPFGTCISGYFIERRADGILDPLQAHAVAFTDGERTAAAVSLDVIGINQQNMDIIRRRAAEKNGLDYEAVFLACTHTHTGPEVNAGRLFEINPTYNEYLFDRISDAITLAIADMKEATMETARSEAKGISFVRRFRMKDGSTKTNPGDDPEVVGPIGTPDEMVQLVKIVREGAADIAIVNFQVHPDTIGGCKFSADYPEFPKLKDTTTKPTLTIFPNNILFDVHHTARNGVIAFGASISPTKFIVKRNDSNPNFLHL